MKRIKGKPFVNQDVPLDGHHYEGCTFQSCTFVYAGVDSFGLDDNTISTDCCFRFTGKAANTVSTMRAIYSMGEWGRRHVLATIQEIAPDIKNLH